MFKQFYAMFNEPSTIPVYTTPCYICYTDMST